MSEFTEEFKKAYEKLDERMDYITAVHDELYKAIVVPMGNMLDGAEGGKLENYHAKGAGKVGEIPKIKVLDGAEGGKIERDLKSKSGSGTSGNVIEGGEPMVDGAKGVKIKK